MADPSAQTYDDASLPGMMGAPVAVTPTEGGYVSATGQQYVPASPTEPGAVRGVSDAGVAPKGAPKTYADTELPGLLPGGVTTAAETPATFGSVLNQVGSHFASEAAGLFNAAGNIAAGPAFGQNIAAGARLLAPTPAGSALANLGNWSQTQPQNLPERVGAVVGEMLPGAAFGPEGEAGALAQLGVRGANVLIPTLGDVGASEGARAMGASPQEQALAGMAGGVLGGFGAAAATGGASALAGAAKPFLANVFPRAAEAQAGQRIANAASDFPAAQSALAGYKPLVEGSPATLGDVTGDLGLIGLSRQAVTKNPEANASLVGDQATARQASLNTLQTGASPAQISDHLKGQLAALDAQSDAAVTAAQQAAQAKASAIGGTGNPEDYGADIRIRHQGLVRCVQGQLRQALQGR